MFTFWIFDVAAESVATKPFEIRWDTLRRWYETHQAWIVPCPHWPVETVDELMEIEQRCVAEGYEGVMVRDPNGPYKWGRSTRKEGYLLKIKRFEDAEAIVVDVTERMHNANEAKVNALGLTERSSHKANQVPTGMLGSLVCNPLLPEPDGGSPCVFNGGVTFEIGTGFTEQVRKDLWQDRPIGKVIKFKYQGLTPDGVPRFPVFLGFRDERDT